MTKAQHLWIVYSLGLMGLIGTTRFSPSLLDQARNASDACGLVPLIGLAACVWVSWGAYTCLCRPATTPQKTDPPVSPFVQKLLAALDPDKGKLWQRDGRHLVYGYHNHYNKIDILYRWTPLVRVCYLDESGAWEPLPMTRFERKLVRRAAQRAFTYADIQLPYKEADVKNHKARVALDKILR